MQKIVKKLQVHVDYPLSQLTSEKYVIYFDIETTGLSATSSQLYLIGTLKVPTKGQHPEAEFTQFFADGLHDEVEVLRAFFDYISDCHTLIHFNGDGFDIPYISTCAEPYYMPHPFDDINSVDIYKRIRPYKKLLGTDRMNQTTLERYLGLNREDTYGGGELISVYQAYTEDHDPKKLAMTLLHNEEDVLDMTLLTSLLNYESIVNSAPDKVSYTMDDNSLTIDAIYPYKVPKKVHICLDKVALSIDANKLTIKTDMYRGVLYHYYSDYKNYFYLPAEDNAIHKSVGEFVEKSARVKATAQTAYTKKEGLYLPIYGPTDLPVFLSEYRGSVRYINAPKKSVMTHEYLTNYISDVLSFFKLKA